MTNAIRLPIGFALAVLGLVLLLWAGTTQASASDKPTLAGASVVSYEHTVPLDNAVRELVQGTGSNGDCTFTVSGEVDANFRGTIIQREVAYDPTTCKSLVEVSTVPQSDVLASSTATKSIQWTGYHRDPVNIPVTWNRSKLRWRYNYMTGQIVWTSGTCPDYWRTATGWYRKWDSGCDKDYGSTEASVSSSRWYHNTGFPCLIGAGASSEIYNHKVTGTGTGTYSYSTNMRKGGACGWLLFRETIFVVL